MNFENTKARTYLVIIVFIIIILLSGYVVIDKIIERNELDSKTKQEETIDSILDNSNSIVELNLSNKIINKLYLNIRDESIDELLYSKTKTLSWDNKSKVIVKLLNDKNIYVDDYVNYDKEIFEEKYKEVFGNDIDIIPNEERIGSTCGSANYDLDNGVYTAKLDCEKDNYTMKTYLKNITMENSMIRVNKYYTFIIPTSVDNDEQLYTIYKSRDLNESSMISKDISYKNINRFIVYMPILSYYFKMDNQGNYYLSYIR